MTCAAIDRAISKAFATAVFCAMVSVPALAADWIASEAGAAAPPSSGTPSLYWQGETPAPRMPDDNPPAGEAASATNVAFSYYTVSGATLRGRSSTVGYTYQSLGCSYTTGGDGILNTELPIPDGATIKYLRVYYVDSNASAGVRGYITRYQPGQATLDLVNVASTAAFAGGYGFAVSSEITEIADNTDYAYTLIGWPDQPSSTLQICGLRVAYYAP